MKEYNKDFKNSLAYYLPWDYLLEDNIVINKYGGLQSTIRVRNYDLDYVEEGDVIPFLARLNNGFKRMEDGWTIHYEVQRKRINEYRTGRFNENIPTKIIDNVRKEMFMTGDHYISEFYITCTYLLPEDNQDKVKNIFMQENIKNIDKEQLIKNFSRELKEYKSKLTSFYDQIKTSLLELEVLKNEELLTYLYSTVNEDRQRIRNPPKGYLLDSILSNTPVTGGMEPMLGNYHLRTISINVFPDKVTPRVFKELERLNFEFRFITRYIMLSREESKNVLEKYRTFHYGKRKNLLQNIIEIFTKTESKNIDESSVQKAGEVNTAITELKGGNLAYGYYTFTFVILDKDLESLENKIQQVKKIITYHDFTCEVDKFNIMESWLGSIPGNITSNIRRYPINTFLLTYLLPTSNIYTGEGMNKHLNDVPLLYTKTTGNSPFRFNLHVGDVGHTLIVGPTGAGKSVHLGLIASQFMKYEKAQVFFFDKDASSRVLTYCLGGEFYDLGEKELAFQPLSQVDKLEEQEFARDWLISILEQENLTITPEKKTIIWEALTSLANTPKEQRTIENFTHFVQDFDIKEALELYTQNGAYGKYFDADRDNFSDNRWIVFEMSKIMKNPKILVPILDYIFHRIEVEKLDGKPTIIILDECWLFLQDEKMKNKIDEWLRVLRKKNTSVIFATQGLSEIANSTIVSSITDACKTQIFLPNDKAISAWLDLYKKFNLNIKEIQTINSATAKKDYYYKSTKGSRLYQLNLSSLELAYCGASNSEDQNKIKEIRDECREDLGKINIEWLEYKKQEVNEFDKVVFNNYIQKIKETGVINNEKNF